MALETIINCIKRYSLIGLASFTVGCSNCDEGNEITKSSCIDYEICGNYNQWGNPLDDDCNGSADEGCDLDGDGFCAEKVRLYSHQGEMPSACEKTFRQCKENPDLCADGVYDCTKTYNYLTNGTCQFFYPDCNDTNYDINPDALEICDGINNNCRLGIDESFPESDLWCDGEGNLYETYRELPGICELGKPACQKGIITCSNYIGPQEQEHCNKLDDDCNPKTKDILLTDARECYTGPAGTKGVGICMGGAELCVNGVVGDDGICHGEQLPQEEKCNCINDDCDKDDQGNELIDEGLYSTEKLNISMNFDTSDSMDNFYGPIAQLANTENTLFCASSDKVKISTVSIGVNNPNRSIPVLKGSLRTVEDFASNFRDDIPSTNGPYDEANLNAIVYAACDILERSFIPDALCDEIQPYNTLRASHPDNMLGAAVFDVGARLIAVIYSDEGSQFPLPPGANTFTFPEINQEMAANIAYSAGIRVIIYTNGNNTLYLGSREPYIAGGWGYFALLDGEVRSIFSINEPDDLEQLIKSGYCIEEQQTKI